MSPMRPKTSRYPSPRILAIALTLSTSCAAHQCDRSSINSPVLLQFVQRPAVHNYVALPSRAFMTVFEDGRVLWLDMDSASDGVKSNALSHKSLTQLIGGIRFLMRELRERRLAELGSETQQSYHLIVLGDEPHHVRTQHLLGFPGAPDSSMDEATMKAWKSISEYLVALKTWK